MSYNDPYSQQYAHQDQYAHQNQYAEGPEYNPYGGERQPHQTYAQEPAYEPYSTPAGGYQDNTRVQSPEQTPFPPNFQNKEGTFANETPSEFRRRKYGKQSGLWGGGGNVRCVGRFCGCTILVFLFLLISIILSLLLWVRPPNIVIGTITPPTSSDVQVSGDGLTIPLSIDISVDNPNYFAVDLNQITANLFYPINNTPIGNGTKSKITFASNSQTNFTFGFNVSYSTTNDPNDKVLLDLATKCGVIGGTQSPITIDYDIKLGIHLGVINISPTISNSMNFACPVTAAEIQSLGGSILGNL